MNSETYTDVSIIIGMMPDEMKSKISKEFINFIETHKSINYFSNINPNVPLSKQVLKEETKVLLGIIYRDYLCDEMEKVKLFEKDKEELAKLEFEKREKYNPDNLFKKETQKEMVKEFALAQYKESIFKRFFKKIKSILINMSNKNT